MFIAVVYKHHFDTDPKSHRDTGGWEAFLGYTKEEAIDQAVMAANRWELVRSDHAGKSYGPYQVLVGELTESAKRTQYTLISLAPAIEQENGRVFDPRAFEDVPF